MNLNINNENDRLLNNLRIYGPSYLAINEDIFLFRDMKDTTICKYYYNILANCHNVINSSIDDEQKDEILLDYFNNIKEYKDNLYINIFIYYIIFFIKDEDKATKYIKFLLNNSPNHYDYSYDFILNNVYNNYIIYTIFRMFDHQTYEISESKLFYIHVEIPNKLLSKSNRYLQIIYNIYNTIDYKKFINLNPNDDYDHHLMKILQITTNKKIINIILKECVSNFIKQINSTSNYNLINALLKVPFETLYELLYEIVDGDDEFIFMRQLYIIMTPIFIYKDNYSHSINHKVMKFIKDLLCKFTDIKYVIHFILCIVHNVYNPLLLSTIIHELSITQLNKLKEIGYQKCIIPIFTCKKQGLLQKYFKNKKFIKFITSFKSNNSNDLLLNIIIKNYDLKKEIYMCKFIMNNDLFLTINKNNVLLLDISWFELETFQTNQKFQIHIIKHLYKFKEYLSNEYLTVFLTNITDIINNSFTLNEYNPCNRYDVLRILSYNDLWINLIPYILAINYNETIAENILLNIISQEEIVHCRELRNFIIHYNENNEYNFSYISKNNNIFNTILLPYIDYISKLVDIYNNIFDKQIYTYCSNLMIVKLYNNLYIPIRSDDICIVCLENKVNLKLIKCKHDILCVECFNKIIIKGNNSCPYCRCKFDNLQNCKFNNDELLNLYNSINDYLNN